MCVKTLMPLCLAFMACLRRVFSRPLAVRGLLIWFYFFLLFSRKTHVEDMSGKESKVTFFLCETFESGAADDCSAFFLRRVLS